MAPGFRKAQTGWYDQQGGTAMTRSEALEEYVHAQRRAQREYREKIAAGQYTYLPVLDDILEKANVVGTPGSGFGPSGEGYFRLTAFGSYENTREAIERIKKM